MPTSTAPLPFFFLALAVLVVAILAMAAGTVHLLLRARRARHRLAVEIHDRALALDQRCDALHGELDLLREQARLAHLFDLIACAQSEGRLESGAAQRLRRRVLEWRAESLAEG